MSKKLEGEIKKYKLDDLLYLLAESSRRLFLENKSFEEIIWQKSFGVFTQSFKQLVPAWNLADLSYIAIKNSNDYRAKTPTIEDIYKLSDLLVGIKDETFIKRKGNITNEDMKTYIFWGLSQEQFRYQEVFNDLSYNFIRYFILLLEIPRSHFPNYKQPNDDLFKLTGFDLKTFAQLIMIGFAWLQVDSVVSFKIADDLKKRNPFITEENLRSCLNHFVGDYTYYRNINFPNNPLLLRPIIKTDTNKYIISNAFLWARKIYEGIYWLIRDKYIKLQSQEFLNNFGQYYEKYVGDFLNFYLSPSKYKKIEKCERKNADWLIETDKYILVIEQKSCLMTISLKNEDPYLPELDKYLNNFVEAYSQIAGTISDLDMTKKTVIKFILHFEKLYIGESIIKERVNKLCINKIRDLDNYFFIDTEAFEKLIQLLVDDEETFNKVLETKLQYGKNPPSISDGIEFIHVINKYAHISEIRFLEKYKYLFDGLFEGIL